MSSTFQSLHSSKGENKQIGSQSLKIVLIGDPKVGKTTLRRSYKGKEFRTAYIPTLGADFSATRFRQRGYNVNITMWDLSAQYRFFNVHPQYYIGASGAIVVYDVENGNPVEQLTEWIDRYIRYSGRHDGPILVLQNKIDLLNPNDEAEYKLKHKEIMKKLNIYYHNKVQLTSTRVSAKTNENVNKTINQFFVDVLDYEEDHNHNTKLTNQQENGLYAQAACLMTFDEMMGPVIIAKTPPKTKESSANEVSSAVRLYSGFTFDDIVESQYQTGIVNWRDPSSFMYYISFVLEDNEARGGYVMYVIGVNVSRDLKQFLAEYNSTIDGYLHIAMNRFSEFIQHHEFDLSDENDVLLFSEDPEVNFQLHSIINDVRRRVHGLISRKLSS